MEVIVKQMKYFGLFILLCVGCRNMPVIVPIPTGEPEGHTVGNTGCKIIMSMPFDDQYPSNWDVIKYTYANKTLHLKHINTAFNCCPDSVGGHIAIEDNKIEIDEFELGPVCDCICLFDVEYQIDNLDEDRIQLNLTQLYLDDDAKTHNLIISLADSTEGIHKIDRGNHYPWIINEH